jgi:alpha-D-ribose 1-methylphosphonate 5-triphosphate synthase subunit PhnG
LTRSQERHSVLATVTRTRKPKAVWNVERFVEDMAVRRMNELGLARASGLAHPTIRKFLDGEVQTSKTAGKMADALGHPIRRYLLRIQRAA